LIIVSVAAPKNASIFLGKSPKPLALKITEILPQYSKFWQKDIFQNLNKKENMGEHNF